MGIKTANNTYRLTSDNFRVYEIQMFDGKPFYLDMYKSSASNDEWFSPVSNTKFCRFILWKRNFTTQDAISTIAKRLSISKNRFKCAGNKDKHAETIQMCSVYNVSPSALMQISAKDIEILYAVNSDSEMRMGELLGNKFEIHLDKIMDKVDTSRLESVKKRFASLLNTGYIPNYFGRQRFGTSRFNTHIVGLSILRGDFESAVQHILTDTDYETNPEITRARKYISETHDYAKAYEMFPKYMRIERGILRHLRNAPTDYAGALRTIPRTTLLMYIHAVQSLIFNRSIHAKMKSDDLRNVYDRFCEETFGFPNLNKIYNRSELSNNEDTTTWPVEKIIGYATELDENDEKLLDELDLVQDDFRVRRMPEIASRGTYRIAYAPIINGYIQDNKITFSLPSGSYATVVLDTLFGNEPFVWRG